MAFYLDTSAAVKLVVSEPQSKAMGSWADAHADSVVSSDMLRTELLRATLRGAPDQMPRARAVLDSITILTLPTALFERAAELEPTLLRSLDALHLAAALDLGDELDAVVTYDDRLTEAARLHGVTVIAPI
ncbi:MAG: type II toxin-antitoxin system VapC family toxin [Acidimicrobiia bacterium]|nr:type II toxin-antitoxin system VapC family toxin [Acidimicrobiia bacterium]